MAKGVSKTDRHLRWNWEQSPDDRGKVRYHVIVVDNKQRPRRLFSVLEQIQSFSSVEPIRQIEDKVENSPHRYLFESFDVNVKPAEIDFSKIGLPVVRDKELYERLCTSGIENYVMGIYSSRN
jgi:hypothetical protein